MTTGSKGLYVVIPIQPKHDFDQIRTFVREKAQQLVNKYPDKLATQLAKEKRGNRVFLDYLRNAFGQTAVAPYSLRAIENTPVATPLDWSELSSLDNAQKYNLSNIFRRLAQKQDPWQNLYKKKNTTISL